MCVKVKVKLLVTQWCPTLCDPMYCRYPTRLFCLWDSPGKNTGVGSYFFLQGILPTQGLNLGLQHCRQILYHLTHWDMCVYIYIHTHTHTHTRTYNVSHNTRRHVCHFEFSSSHTEKDKKIGENSFKYISLTQYIQHITILTYNKCRFMVRYFIFL